RRENMQLLLAVVAFVFNSCLYPDAGRVAPISACVSYQIDRLKSGFEATGRTVMPGNCALMGATH
ncbi:hypothetical protein, partial [Prevotellamassilia timonensis]|uniref:hypothetical protein n=1 Tax=Prevotellamassilia timonensis TaxID=1852370 RepID=UPI003FF0C19F